MARYAPRMLADVSLTWAHISACQLRTRQHCIHAIYICTSVLPPHWRALSSITRRGRPAARSASSTAASLRCGALSTKGSNAPRVLCFMRAHVAHQYSKSWRHRNFCHSVALARAALYAGSASIAVGTRCLRGEPGAATSLRGPMQPVPATGS
ncbi:hypothetical protein IMSAGC008_02323 [Muribaculaceae bacterium]|nr:hypothetical protein IMSAGC008_02323 [Muribaculaceae bacterium]